MASDPEASRSTLWTPPMPQAFFAALAGDDGGAARLLWAAYCVPERYRLAPHRWRQEARLITVGALDAARRRLRAHGLLDDRSLLGPGLCFDGQHWQRRTTGPQLTFLALQPTPHGLALVRAALGAISVATVLPPPPDTAQAA